MSIHRFDHVDLRVSDFAEARKFYDVFLPALGFPKIRAGKSEVSYYAEGNRKTSPFIGLNEEPGHRRNANRFAFWADTEEEVNRLCAIIRDAGAQNIEGPEYCHEYTPGYYAVFFEDADGNKWEICCRNTRLNDEARKAAGGSSIPKMTSAIGSTATGSHTRSKTFSAARTATACVALHERHP